MNQYASTPDTGFGGRHFYLAEELAKLGYKVYLISASFTHLLRNPIEIDKEFLIDSSYGFNMVWVRTSTYQHAHSKKRILNWFYFCWKLTQLTKVISQKPDTILYSSPTLVGYLGAEYLATKLKCKLVFEVRDIWPLTLRHLGGYSKYHPFILFLQWIESRAYKKADIVVSNLKYAVEHMQQHGLNVRKFYWISNGFSLQEVTNKQPLDKETITQLPKDKFIVGYTGTLGLANAMDFFIKAAKKLQSYNNIAFVVVGDGKKKESLINYCKQNKVNNVYFIDTIPKNQIQSMLSEFDVCYLGVKKDPLYGFGVSLNKLFDYLYSAKPIIYAIDSGKYRPISEVNAGYEVEPENPIAITEAIIKLYHLSSMEREQLGRNGKKLALEYYEYSQLAKKLADICMK
ncbi:glycosyltransferase family 4 protein [Psychrobacter sp. I-STPA6b]|uniref:glycosyltransferase family 4 protein n=1 Tax=Psychrobacter sp. I-STPA6b TaxID=2585718 RepID=UPI001D0C6282|nr:glycosyltransferase family 4 protein [Psychrobacter sp. I-STPA6b]